jgi:hypothetical protein
MRGIHRNLEKVLHALDHHDLSTIHRCCPIIKCQPGSQVECRDLAAVCEMETGDQRPFVARRQFGLLRHRNRDRVEQPQGCHRSIGFEVSEEITCRPPVFVVEINTPSPTTRRAPSGGTASAWRSPSRLLYKMKFTNRAMDPFMWGCCTIWHRPGTSVLFDDGFRDAVTRRAENKSCWWMKKSLPGDQHEEIGEAVARKWNFPRAPGGGDSAHHTGLDSGDDEYSIDSCRPIAEYFCFQQQQGYSDFSDEYAVALARAAGSSRDG